MCRLQHAVDRLRAGDPAAVVDMIELLERGALLLFRRMAGEGAHNHEIVLRLLLRTAQKTMDGRVETAPALCRSVLAGIREAARAVQHQTPPQTVNISRLQAVYRRIPEEDREALRRYYVQGCHRDDICRDLGMDLIRLDKILTRVRKTVSRETKTRKPALPLAAGGV